MKIKKILLVLGVAAIATMSFVACSSGEEAAQDTTTEVSDTVEATEVEEATEATEVAVETTEVTNETDGIYRVEYDQADEQGWKTFLEVTVKDGIITNVNFDEVNVSDDEADNALEEALLTATTPEEFEEMIAGQIDAETFKAFMEQLMPQIEQGNKETIVVNR